MKGMIGQVQWPLEDSMAAPVYVQQQHSVLEGVVKPIEQTPRKKKWNMRVRLRDLRSPVRTTSKGPVQPLPHVQPTILEYRPKLDNSSTDADSI